MNVLQVINSLAIGGLEKVVVNIVNNQIENDKINFSVLCLEKRETLAEFIHPSVEIFELDKNNTSYLKLIFTFVKIVKQKKIEIIHCHNFAPLLFSVIIKILTLFRVKLVYTEHNQIYSISKKHYKRFKYLIKFVDSVVTVSKDLQIQFAKLNLAKKTTVIWNGILQPKYDIAEIAGLNKKFRENSRDFLIGTAVVMTEQKGLTYLIEASREFVKKYPEIKFLIIGDGPLSGELKEQVVRYKLTKNYYFLGYQKDVIKYLKILDVFVMPSLWEGFSISLLEASAMGLPIITTNVGGNSEIVENRETGLLIPPKDVTALSNAIIELYTDSNLRKKFAKNSKLNFDMNFTILNMVEHYHKIYKELITS